MDDVLSDFLGGGGGTSSPDLASKPHKPLTPPADEPQAHNLTAASIALDDVLADFELPLSETKEEPTAAVKKPAPPAAAILEFVPGSDEPEPDENNSLLPNIQPRIEPKAQKPKTPPSKSKKVQGSRRPKYRKASAEPIELLGGELGGSLLAEGDEIKTTLVHVVPKSRYLREREADKREEEVGEIRVAKR